MTKKLNELYDALRLAVANADGDAEKFAFFLAAPLASWMSRGMLDEDATLAEIQLLHQLHPNVSV